MTSPEIGRLLANRPVVILPVGATEQHGPHLPLDTDTALVVEVARRAAALAGNTLVLPALPFGFSPSHAGFPGTVTLSMSSLFAVVTDVCRSVIRHGVRRILLLSGHNANKAPLEGVARELSVNGVVVAAANYFDFARDMFNAVRRSAPGGEAHAGEMETALQMYLRPHLVHLELAEANPAAVDIFGWSPAVVGSDYRVTTPHGVKGDPTVATPEVGKATLEGAVAGVAAFIARFREDDP